MNSTTLLMLSRAIEADRRREIENRHPRRFVEPEVREPRERRFGAHRWFRIRGLAASRA